MPSNDKEPQNKYDLKEIIEFLPDATFIVNINGKIIVWNKAMEELTKLKAENMVGKTRQEYSIPFYGKVRPILIDLVLKHQKEYEKKYLVFDKKNDTLTAEVFIPHFRKDGGYLWAKARPLYDSKGNVIGAIETIRDITNHIRAKQKLNERIKEINCLYEIIKLIDHPVISLEEILKGTLEILPSGWQFPDLICAQIIFRNHNYEMPNFQETPWKLSCKNHIRDMELVINVYYLENKEFLAEEVQLLKKISNQLKFLIDFKLEWEPR